MILLYFAPSVDPFIEILVVLKRHISSSLQDTLLQRERSQQKFLWFYRVVTRLLSPQQVTFDLESITSDTGVKTGRSSLFLVVSRQVVPPSCPLDGSPGRTRRNPGSCRGQRRQTSGNTTLSGSGGHTPSHHIATRAIMKRELIRRPSAAWSRRPP